MSEGELIEAKARKRFWRMLMLCGIGAAPIGLAMGYGFGRTGHIDAFWKAAPDAAVVAMVAGALILFLYGCWRFAKAIDEVELLDNLWASTAAYYTYGVLFPAWWMLSQADVVRAPDGWAVYFIALAIGAIEYCRRKWVAR